MDTKEYYRLYRLRNKEKLKQYHKQWRESHPDNLKQSSKKYRELHPNLKDKYKTLRQERDHIYRSTYRSTPKGFFTRQLTEIRRKRLNKECSITLEHLLSLWEQQGGICRLTGRDMDLGGTIIGKGYNPFRASIDRIDSSLGYIEGNVHLICAWANIAKHVLSCDDFVIWCKSVVTTNCM